MAEYDYVTKEVTEQSESPDSLDELIAQLLVEACFASRDEEARQTENSENKKKESNK